MILEEDNGNMLIYGNSWCTPNLRESVIRKLDDALHSLIMPITKTGIEMENHVFQKAKTKEEYLNFIARLVLHIRKMSNKEKVEISRLVMPNASEEECQAFLDTLYTLARYRTGNNHMLWMVRQDPNQ